MMEVGIPANTVATVRIPTAKPESVRLDDVPVGECKDVKVLRREPAGLPRSRRRQLASFEK